MFCPMAANIEQVLQALGQMTEMLRLMAVNQEAQAQQAVPTAGEQHAEKRVEANDKVWEKNLNVSAQDKSNCDHQHESTGKLSQSEAENFRDENATYQSKIEIVWNVRDPCVLFSDELSRRDNKGLSNQDGEVLIPINMQRQNSR